MGVVWPQMGVVKNFRARLHIEPPNLQHLPTPMSYAVTLNWIRCRLSFALSSLGATPSTGREGLVHFASRTCSALSANVGQLIIFRGARSAAHFRAASRVILVRTRARIIIVAQKIENKIELLEASAIALSSDLTRSITSLQLHTYTFARFYNTRNILHGY